MNEEQVLREANALDAQYAAAELFDLKHQNKYLLQVIHNLYTNVIEDIPEENIGRHLWDALGDAAEVLGLE